MDSDLDTKARAWASRIARAYAAAARSPVTPEAEAWIARELQTPMATCEGEGVSSSDWAPDYVNPALMNWEKMTGRPPGPRLARVDYGAGSVTMGW